MCVSGRSQLPVSERQGCQTVSYAMWKKLQLLQNRSSLHKSTDDAMMSPTPVIPMMKAMMSPTPVIHHARKLQRAGTVIFALCGTWQCGVQSYSHYVSILGKKIIIYSTARYTPLENKHAFLQLIHNFQQFEFLYKINYREWAERLFLCSSKHREEMILFQLSWLQHT